LVWLIYNADQQGAKRRLISKQRDFFGGEYNVISAKVKRNKDTLYTLSGKWDERIDITNTKTKNTELFWDPKGAKRIPKSAPSLEEQAEMESQKLWSNVSVAIKKKDQKEATAEKTKLEEAQRAAVKQRKESGDEWEPRLFVPEGDDWVYRYINTTPYDPKEGAQEESEGIIYSAGIGKEATINLADSRVPVASSGSLTKSSSAITKQSSGSFLSLSGGMNKSKSQNGKGK